MKATIISTDEVIEVHHKMRVRIWEGVTEKGVPFRAYVAGVIVAAALDQSEFADLQERAAHVVIDPRFAV